jgi:hypothetical protein
VESDAVVAGTDLVGGSVDVVVVGGVVVVDMVVVAVVVGVIERGVVVMDEVGIEEAVRIQCSEQKNKANTVKVRFSPRT